MTGEQRIQGKIVSITGPDSLELGKTVSLLVTVAVNDSFCIKRAEGKILASRLNYIQLGADLVYSGRKDNQDCDCINEERIYTIVYFTPNVAGHYVFGIDTPTAITNVWSEDSITYHGIVN